MLMLLAGSLNQNIILLFSIPYSHNEKAIAEMGTNYYWHIRRKLVLEIINMKNRRMKWEPESFVI